MALRILCAFEKKSKKTSFYFNLSIFSSLFLVSTAVEFQITHTLSHEKPPAHALTYTRNRANQTRRKIKGDSMTSGSDEFTSQTSDRWNLQLLTAGGFENPPFLHCLMLLERRYN